MTTVGPRSHRQVRSAPLEGPSFRRRGSRARGSRACGPAAGDRPRVRGRERHDRRAAGRPGRPRARADREHHQADDGAPDRRAHAALRRRHRQRPGRRRRRVERQPAGGRAVDRPRAARGGADPERERRRRRARRLRRQGKRGALRRADEPACAAARPARHALRPARRPRRDRARLQRPRRDAARPDPDAPAARAADRPPAGGDDRGRAHAAHLERPALELPGHLRRQDRPHLGCRLERGRGGAPRAR